MKKVLLSAPVSFLIALILMAGCSQQYAALEEATGFAGEPMPLVMNASLAEGAIAADFAGKAQRAEAPSPGQAPGADLTAMTASQPDRYLIKNARLTIETEDARKAADQLAAIVVASGGYTSDLREHQDGLGARTVSLQVRVPADRFDETMQQLEPVGKILDKQVTAEDVTEQFIDTEAKTRNLKKTEERLLDHLNRSAKLEDILAAEREITRIRGQIEQLEGRLRFLSHRIAYSTLQVTLRESPKPKSVIPVDSFSTGEVASDAVRSLVAFAQQIWVVVIWVGIWSPVWVIFPLIVWYLIRRGKRQPYGTAGE